MIENDYLNHAINMQYDENPIIRQLADNLVDLHRKLAHEQAKSVELERIVSALYRVRDNTVCPDYPDAVEIET